MLQTVIGHPGAQGTDLFFRFVEAGDKEVGDFHVDAGAYHGQDVFQYGGQRGAAVFAVEAIVHSLDVDVGGIKIWQQLPQRFFLYIAGRNKYILDAFLVGQDGDAMHILPPGEGLGVGISDGREAAL